MDSDQRIRAVIHRAQSMIVHILQPSLVERDNESISRFDAYLSVSSAINQHQWWRVWGYIVYRRSPPVIGSPRTTRISVHKLNDSGSDLVMFVLVQKVNRSTVTHHGLH